MDSDDDAGYPDYADEEPVPEQGSTAESPQTWNAHFLRAFRRYYLVPLGAGLAVFLMIFLAWELRGCASGRSPYISEPASVYRPLPLVARAANLSFGVTQWAEDGHSLTLGVDTGDTAMWETAWLTVAAFGAPPDLRGYLAERMPGRMVAGSFYAASGYSWPPRDFPHGIMLNDDDQIAPTTALEIQNDAVVGMYSVTSFRFCRGLLSPAVVDEISYRELAKEEVVKLVPCTITPHFSSYFEGGIQHPYPYSMDVHCSQLVSSFNWLIVPAETPWIFRYREEPGSRYYDRDGYHYRTTELAEPFYYIINLNIMAPKEEAGKSE